jgi:hypothetical protein
MKVWYYIFILSGLMIFLHIAGLPSGASPVFDILNIQFGENRTITSAEVTNGTLFNKLFDPDIGILLLAVGASILVGFLTKQTTENFILLPLITIVGVSYVQTLVGLITYVLSLGDGVVSTIMALIFIPLTAGFIWALAEFFRGTD